MKLNVKTAMFIYFMELFVNVVKGAVPGTFFWKPRIGLTFDVTAEQEEKAAKLAKEGLTEENIAEGLAVILKAYYVGITFVALSDGYASSKKYRDQNPFSPYFYTNAYRWLLRYIDLLPGWIGQTHGHYTETHKVWQGRYDHLDDFVPNWMRTVLNLFVDKTEWKKEEKEYKKYVNYAEPAFAKHYVFPNKVFNDYASQIEGGASIDVFGSSDLSINKAQ